MAKKLFRVIIILMQILYEMLFDKKDPIGKAIVSETLEVG